MNIGLTIELQKISLIILLNYLMISIIIFKPIWIITVIQYILIKNLYLMKHVSIIFIHFVFDLMINF